MHIFWGMKKLVQLKFVQLLLLNRVKGKMIKKPCSSRFYYINSFSSNIFGPNSKTCTSKVRAAWGRVSRGLTVFSIVVIKIISHVCQKEPLRSHISIWSTLYADYKILRFKYTIIFISNTVLCAINLMMQVFELYKFFCSPKNVDLEALL